VVVASPLSFAVSPSTLIPRARSFAFKNGGSSFFCATNVGRRESEDARWRCRCRTIYEVVLGVRPRTYLLPCRRDIARRLQNLRVRRVPTRVFETSLLPHPASASVPRKVQVDRGSTREIFHDPARPRVWLKNSSVRFWRRARHSSRHGHDENRTSRDVCPEPMGARF
jgi:hypothetical protein